MEKSNVKKHAARSGFGIGTIIAVIISWSVNHSVIWAIIHGLLGWWYVLYYLIFIR